VVNQGLYRDDGSASSSRVGHVLPIWRGFVL
jgi:hypothetical protein